MSAAANKTFLGNLAISVRIGFLIVLGLLGLAIAEGVSFYGAAQISDAMRTKDTFTQIDTTLLNADNGALLLRRREKDFLIRKDLKYRDGYTKDHAKTIADLEAIKSIPQAAPAINDINAIISKLNEHRDQFYKVVEMTQQLGLKETEGLQGSLRKAVHDVETKLKDANLNQLTVKMLMMRRHEKDFMLRGAEKYLGRIDARRTEFNELLPGVALSLADQNDLGKLLDNYQAEMKKFGAVTIAKGPEIKRLSAIYGEMAGPSDALHAFARDGLAQASQNAMKAESQTQTLLLSAAVIIAVVLAALGVLVMRSLTGPLSRITLATTELADGHRNVDVPATDNTDEVGEMARALLVFKDNLAESERLKAAQEAAEQRAIQERLQSRLDLADHFEAAVGGIVNSVSSSATEMQSSAQTLSATAEQTSQQSSAVAAASEQASANVQTVASASEELSASITEISGQVAQSTQISSTAVAEVEGANDKVQGLAEAAQKIGEVVALITDIADQTNLLALNATIEAARAGEAGKGFAVVASEVKNLANQTAKATEAISSQIGGIQTATQDAVSAIGSIGGIINQINEISSAIAAAVEEQGAATQEIARNVEQASAGTAEVSSNITVVNQAATETGASAHQLLSASNELSQQSETLNNEVDKLLNEIRSETDK